MNTRDAITDRRSIKAFDPDHQIPDEIIHELISMAMLSPTAFNIQHWRFVIVSDEELRNDIREVSWNQSQVTDASLFIVLCADVKAWEKQPERYWENASEEAQAFILPAIDAYYRGSDQTQRDEVMRSCGIAAQTLMLTAKSMGYDSCPMDGFDFDAVARLIKLPDDYVIAMFVAIGKGIKAASPRGGQLGLKDVVIENRFDHAA